MARLHAFGLSLMTMLLLAATPTAAAPAKQDPRVAQLVQVLSDEGGSNAAQREAVEKLKKIVGAAGDDAAALLLPLMKSPQANLRAAAFESVGSVKAVAPEMLAAVRAAAQSDADTPARYQAVYALGQLAPRHPEVVDDIMAALREPYMGDVVRAAATLGAEQTWPRFVPLLEDPDRMVREQAVRFFGSERLKPEVAKAALNDVAAVRARATNPMQQGDLDAVVMNLTALATLVPKFQPVRAEVATTAPGGTAAAGTSKPRPQRPPRNLPPIASLPQKLQDPARVFADMPSAPDYRRFSGADVYNLREQAEPLIPFLEYALADAIARDHVGDHRAVSIALSHIPSPKVIPALVHAADAADDRKTEALYALEYRRDAAVQPILQAAVNPDYANRQELIVLLGKINTPAAHGALEHLARHAEQADRDLAARVLADAKQRTPEAMAKALAAARGSEQERLIREVPNGTAFCVKVGLTLVAHEKPDIRQIGITMIKRSLSALRDAPNEIAAAMKGHEATLAGMLKDGDPSVRELVQTLQRRTGTSIGGIEPSAGATDDSAVALNDGADVKQRVAAIQRIAERGAAVADPILLKVMRSRIAPMPVVNEAIARYLALDQSDERLVAAMKSDLRPLAGHAASKAVMRGDAGVRLVLRTAGEMDRQKRQRLMNLFSANVDTLDTAFRVIDEGDPKLRVPATYVIAQAYSYNVLTNPTPTPAAIARIAAMLTEPTTPEARKAASAALRRMAGIASDPVLALLKSEDVETRRWAARTLTAEESRPAEADLLPVSAFEPLLAACDDADAQVREHAASALSRLARAPRAPSRLGQPPPQDDHVRAGATEKLRAMMDDADPDVRAAAFLGLWRFGEAYREMQAAQGHANPSIRWTARMLLADWNRNRGGRREPPPPPPAVPELLAIIGDANESGWNRARAAQELARHGQRGAAGTAVLTELLEKSPRANVRTRAAEALGAVGGGADAAAQAKAAAAMLAAFDDPDPIVAQWAMRSIGGLGAAAKAAIPRLVKIALSEEEPLTADGTNFDNVAFHALGQMGPAAIDALGQMLNPSAGVPMDARAAEALGTMGAAAAPAVPALVAALQRDRTSGYAAEKIVIALGKIGPPAAKEAAPALTKIVAAPKHEAWVEAVQALAQLGPAAATPEVLSALAGCNSAWANNTLGKFGPAAAPVAPQLAQQVQKAADIRKAIRAKGGGVHVNFSEGGADTEAALALGRMGPAAAPVALPALQAALAEMPSEDSYYPAEVIRQAIARVQGKQSLTTPDVRAPYRPSGLIETGQTGAE